MLVGALLARSGSWSKEFFQQLSRFMVRVALPIYFFVKLSNINPADIRTGILFPFAAVCVVALNWGCASIVFRFFPEGAATKRVGMALSIFGNSGMIPLTLIEIFPLTLPLIAERFGTTLPSLYVGAYLLVQSPALWSLGNFLVAGKGHRPTLRNFITPPLIGIMTGLFVALLGLQPVLQDSGLPFYHVLKSLERFGSVTFSVILLCLGAMIARIQFGENSRKELITQALAVSMTRFVIIPALFIFIYLVILQRFPLSPAQKWSSSWKCISLLPAISR